MSFVTRNWLRLVRTSTPTTVHNARLFNAATTQQNTIVNNNNNDLNIHIDMIESPANDAWLIHGELLGVPKENIAVAVRNGVLTISVQKESSVINHHGWNQSRMSLQRSVRLPQAVDDSHVSWRFADGMLDVVVRKPGQYNDS